MKKFVIVMLIVLAILCIHGCYADTHTLILDIGKNPPKFK